MTSTTQTHGINMAATPFKTVDVFTNVPFKGNPVAVVLNASSLSTADMQQIARWTNLSETTFVIPATISGADYQVRIFTPCAELPFAGHPTIGTAHALLETGMIKPKNGVLTQQCGAGLIKLYIEYDQNNNRWISFGLPEPRLTALNATQVKELISILGTPLKLGTIPYLVDVGARWVVAQLPTAQAVLNAIPDLNRMRIQDEKGKHTGVVIFGEHSQDSYAKIEVRAFAPAHGVSEDPVCGSGNGAVAAYIRHTNQIAAFGANLLATQGKVLGRAGFIKLLISESSILVAGNAITCIEGNLNL